MSSQVGVTAPFNCPETKGSCSFFFFFLFYYTFLFFHLLVKASVVFLPEQKIKSPNVTISAGGCYDVNLSI